MTSTAIALAIVCQLLVVTGQLLLKRAMNATVGDGASWSTGVRRLAVALTFMTAWFFLWLGLLQRWEISRLFPFEGLNPAIIALAAGLLLKERLPLASWVGIGLISVGLVLVAGS